MDEFIKTQLYSILLSRQMISQAADNIDMYITAIYGYCAGRESGTESWLQNQIQSPIFALQGNGFGNQQSTLLEVIKDMIVELKIKGSVRERANGLIELRTHALGSIYGRTKTEIATKLTQKLKEAKQKKETFNKKNKTPLLSEFFSTDYLPYKKTELSPSTIKAYVQYMKRIETESFDKPLNSYTTADIEKYLLAIPQTRTRQVLRGVFNNILTYAKRMGKIKSNPCDNVAQVKHTKKAGRALSFDAQNDLFDNLYSNNSIDLARKAFITFTYLTGTRRNEALSITVKDVDFENKVLHIPGTKTKGSNRFMPLTPLVEKLLQKITPDANGRYFPFAQHTSYDLMEKISDEYHLHELRHTFGTIAICVRKVDPKTVSLWLGHSTVSMTLTTYTHPEQLNQGLFYDGSKTEEEKIAIMQEQYESILGKINRFWE